MTSSSRLTRFAIGERSVASSGAAAIQVTCNVKRLVSDEIGERSRGVAVFVAVLPIRKTLALIKY